MKNSSIKNRIISKFGEGFYYHTFKRQVEFKCSEAMFERFYHKKFNRFYFKLISKGTKQELYKFRNKNYFKSLWERIYKEHGEEVLSNYNNSNEYLEMLYKKREELYKSFKD